MITEFDPHWFFWIEAFMSFLNKAEKIFLTMLAYLN